MSSEVTLKGKQVYDCIVQNDTVVITFTDGSFITIIAETKLRLRTFGGNNG